MAGMILVTAGHTDGGSPKTAVNLLRYKGEEVVAVYDPVYQGKTCQEVFGVGGETPVIGSLEEGLPADRLVIGVAPAGGRIPAGVHGLMLQAISHRMTIVSGLHEFLNQDPELVRAAERYGARLVDIRRNEERDVAKREGIEERCLRIHTVGHDCNVGKMVVSLEVSRALAKAGYDAKFVATGQTGILIEGDGCPVDAVVVDFINGAAEKLVLAHQHHQILLIEGQGSLVHPKYSAVTLGLLHGCVPDGLILCYEMGRDRISGMEEIPIPSLKTVRQLYETMANVMHPCRVIGVAVNSRRFTEGEAERERHRVEAELEVPVCDVYRQGPDKLEEAVVKRGRELGKIK